ncbi:MAG: hypothetical protein FJX63_00965 [Alphaproteobacteria bacterium]|nr:hypothetical protein [Alphaproteobacteria bacterium]
MSFLKKLFGGGSSETVSVKTVTHNGFTIEARPYREGGQFQTAGLVWKDVDGARKEHKFIRADRFASEADAADHALFKGKQIVDQLGDAMFKS